MSETQKINNWNINFLIVQNVGKSFIYYGTKEINFKQEVFNSAVLQIWEKF